jgi:polyphosphate kinase 2 (PPK2 family)
MFETAEIGHRLGRIEFEKAELELRASLLAIQRRVRSAGFQTIVIVSGVEGAGKSEVVNRLHEWLDARGLTTAAFWDESDEERERPRYWRFWRLMPPRGTIGILFGSWYTQPIVARAYKQIRRAEIEADQRLVLGDEDTRHAGNTTSARRPRSFSSTSSPRSSSRTSARTMESPVPVSPS